MTRRVLTLGSLIALALSVIACGSTAPSNRASSAESSPGIDALDLRYKCGAFPFGPELLNAGPGSAEQADNPAAAALRAHLAGSGPDFDFLPDTGWHLTGMDARVAEFVQVGGDLGMRTVSLENGPDGWQVTGWGDCQPRIDLALGLGPAEWAFDLAQARPGPATQVFDALVMEMSCNSGEPADGRIVGPQIVSSAETVLVIFATRPRPGAQACPSNPPTRVRVDLGEPLGDRTLLDGGRLPPGDPAKPRF
jgi:hypothetical protein